MLRPILTTYQPSLGSISSLLLVTVLCNPSSNGLSGGGWAACEIVLVLPALWVAQTIHDWQNFCAWAEKPLVNQCRVMVSNIPPFDTWSNPCVNFAKCGKKCLGRHGLSSGPRHTEPVCVAPQRFHNVFSCGVAKDCKASRELGIETGVETSKGLGIMGLSAAFLQQHRHVRFLRR